MKKTKSKNKYLHFVKERFSRLMVILIAFSMFSYYAGIDDTYAYFSDEVEVSDNIFTAGTLDAKLNQNNLGTVSLDAPTSLSVVNQGSLNFKYEVNAYIENGSDTTFCGQLDVSITDGSNVLYSGGLSGLDFIKELDAGSTDNLSFTIHDAHSNTGGKVCSFNFSLKAWQTNLDYSEGFTDSTSSSGVVYSANTSNPYTSTGVVLNEFLPRPDGIEYVSEWVELYNNGSQAVNLSGWYLGDAAKGNGNETPIDVNHTHGSSIVIGSHKWLVVYMSKDIYNNPGDTVKLFDNTGNLVDSYSYGDDPTYCEMAPTPGSDNDSNPSGKCNASNVPINKSFARIPDGIGDWVDPIPTPGEANELEEDNEEISSSDLVLDTSDDNENEDSDYTSDTPSLEDLNTNNDTTGDSEEIKEDLSDDGNSGENADEEFQTEESVEPEEEADGEEEQMIKEESDNSDSELSSDDSENENQDNNDNLNEN